MFQRKKGKRDTPARLSNITVSRPLGAHNSNTISLHIFRHTTEQHELSVHSRVKCALWTHLDWKSASSWLVAEDVGWSLEPGGCSFINQVGTVNENTDFSLPTLSKITLCCFSCEEQQQQDAHGASPTSTACFVILWEGLSTCGKFNLKNLRSESSANCTLLVNFCKLISYKHHF